MTELQYSSEALDPRHAKVARVMGMVAVFCAVAPMVTGLAVLIAYRLFDWDWLTSAGMLLLPIGTFLFVIGVAFGITWFVRKRLVAKRTGTRCRWSPFIGLILLLLANFPAAFFCVMVGGSMALELPVWICIVNDSKVDLTNVRVGSFWKRKSLGTIKPGCMNEAHFKPWHAKSARVQLEQAGAGMDFKPPVPARPASDMAQIHVKAGLSVETELIRNPGRDSD